MTLAQLRTAVTSYDRDRNEVESARLCARAEIGAFSDRTPSEKGRSGSTMHQTLRHHTLCWDDSGSGDQWL